MTNTHRGAYVIWRKRRYDDRPNAVSGPFAESKFLSLMFLNLNMLVPEVKNTLYSPFV
jgi:hypothetical protein